MASSLESSHRRIVPRWRTFRRTVLAGESQPEKQLLDTARIGEDFVREREAEWAVHKQLLFAADFVCAAYSLGFCALATDAADFVLSHSGSSDLMKQISRAVLGIRTLEFSTAETESSVDDRQRTLRLDLHQLRLRRLDEPRNAFVWMDCARLYVALGLTKPAARAVNVALSLAPFDRFVCRAATRFFLHLGQPDRALRLLRGNERSKHDPWLMAAELAVSSVMERPSKFFKAATSLIESGNHSAFNLSELRTALGGMVMWGGNTRKARLLFRSALEAPTENALAQYVWTSPKIGLEPIALENVHLSKAFEGSCLLALNSSDWQTALKRAHAWAIDESFSSRPFQFGSSLASSVVAEFTDAEMFAREGLQTNPGHPGLLNNLAFSLVGQGRVAEAKAIIERIRAGDCPMTTAICLKATTGLVHYRMGNPNEGRASYEQAITLATHERLDALRVRAGLYYAREECLAGRPGSAQALARACDEASRLHSAELTALAEVVRKDARSATAKSQSR